MILITLHGTQYCYVLPRARYNRQHQAWQAQHGSRHEQGLTLLLRSPATFCYGPAPTKGLLGTDHGRGFQLAKHAAIDHRNP